MLNAKDPYCFGFYGYKESIRKLKFVKRNCKRKQILYKVFKLIFMLIRMFWNDLMQLSLSSGPIIPDIWK